MAMEFKEWWETIGSMTPDELKGYEAGRRIERERCAKIADAHSCGDCHDTICNEQIAARIRMEYSVAHTDQAKVERDRLLKMLDDAPMAFAKEIADIIREQQT
jgi:hypothetical protein